MADEKNTELKAAGPNGRVVPTHSTSVDRTSAWDRTEQFRKMRSPATPAYYNDIFAFQLPDTEGNRKTHYSFIHHYVSDNGTPGAASGRALANSVAVLNGGRSGTVLRGAARQGVYRHIAAHYADAEMEAPELKSDEDVDAIMMFKGLINGPLAETLDLTVKGLEDLNNIIDVESDVYWQLGDAVKKGIVVEADDDFALVEEISEKGERMGEFYELGYNEVKLRTFVVMEKVDGMAEAGAIVSWDTTQGTYYGDVVSVETSGTVRGEPQGLELEGTEENPAYLIRVWMTEATEADVGEEDPEDDTEDEKGMKSAKSEGEWHPTNVTVVARGDALTVVEALPTGGAEEDYDSGTEDEETAMKSIDDEFRVKLAELIKANTEILEHLAHVDVAVEEKADEVVVEDAAVTEEVKADEVATEEVTAVETTDEVKAEESTDEVKADESTDEVKADETTDAAVAEESTDEVKADETVDAPAEEVIAEQKDGITFDELKEFHSLLKEISNQ